MKSFLTGALALIAGLAVARADLGDTPAQAEARYGPAQETKTAAASGVVIKLYVRAGIGIAVKYLDGKIGSETFIKGRKAAFTDPEIALLLKENAMGSDWHSVYKTPGAERWELNSRTATAIYSHSNHTLTFSTKEFIRSENRIKLIDSD